MTVTLSPTGTAGTGASILRIRAAEGASVSLVTIVAAPKGASVLDDTGVELADGASLDARHYVVSCDTCALGLAVNLAGASSRADTALRYLLRDGQSLDANYVARMRGRNSRCDLDFSGVLEDGASKTLRDTIDLAHGAKGARGRENETVLLSGDGVTNKSLPVIL